MLPLSDYLHGCRKQMELSSCHICYSLNFICTVSDAQQPSTWRCMLSFAVSYAMVVMF